MASSIAWTDATGAATLTNGKPGPGGRFAGWRHWRPPIGPLAVAAGTGRTFHWSFREEHLATFELQYIPMASLPLLERLKYHLETGGDVTVTVGDAAAHVHACVIAPGTEVTYEQADRRLREYTLRLTLKNTLPLPLAAAY